MPSLKNQLQLYFDLARSQSSHISKKFVIFGRGRSGSTALVSLLNCLSEVRCDGEIIAQPVLWPQLYIKAKAAKTHKSVYGCKVLSYQLRDTHQIQQGADFLYELNQAGFYILYLRRENLLDHAISNIRARSFGFHKSHLPEGFQKSKIYVDPIAVVDWIEKSQHLWDYELSLLRDIPHLALTYEKNLASERQHQPTIDTICRYLEIRSRSAVSQYQKVSPQTLQASVENYSELVNHLSATPYYHYLEACSVFAPA